MTQLKSATHQKTPNTEHAGKEDNTDNRKKQGQHKRQVQIWTDMDKTYKSVCIAPAIQTCIIKNVSLKSAFSIISPGLAYYIYKKKRSSETERYFSVI